MLILGCGYTGLRLARRRVARDEPVLGIVSSAATAARVAAAGVACQPLDLDQDDLAGDVLRTAQPTVYLVPPPRNGQDDPRLARVLATLRTPRLIYVSTTGVYGNRNGQRVDEQDAPKPESERAARRLAAETRVQQWAQASGCEWVVLRVPGIYGPDRLQLATVRARRPMLHAGVAGPGNRIHVDDLVRCIEAAAITPHASTIYNVGDGNTMTNTEFVAEVAAQLGVEPPPTTDLDTLRARATPQAWSFLRESREVDVTRMRTRLGITPRYEQPKEGIAASLAAMEQN